jgi:GPI ethanolamine phosphate transferase 2/3 subunit F
MPSKKKKTVKLSELLEKDGSQNGISTAEAEQPGPVAAVGSQTAHGSSTGNATFFPLARYISIVGIYSTLLVYSAIFLPQTTFLPGLRPLWTTLGIEIGAPTQTRSADRPEHPFLTPLTLHPALTLMWLCVGVGIVQAWWGGWVRKWALEYQGQVESDEEKFERKHVQWETEKINVRMVHLNTVFGVKLNESFQALKDACMATLASSAFFYVVLILFGAPITRLCLMLSMSCFLLIVTSPQPPFAHLSSVVAFFAFGHIPGCVHTWIASFLQLPVAGQTS